MIAAQLRAKMQHGDSSMTKREDWRQQLARYKAELTSWEAGPETRPANYVGPGDASGIGGTRSQNISRLKMQIARHLENRPK